MCYNMRALEAGCSSFPQPSRTKIETSFQTCQHYKHGQFWKQKCSEGNTFLVTKQCTVVIRPFDKRYRCVG